MTNNDPDDLIEKENAFWEIIQKMKYKNEEVEFLWNSLEDITFDEDEDAELVLAENFHYFEKGTPRNHIWHWFDENHSKGIGYLMWNLKN